MSLIEPIATAAPLLVGWTTTSLFYRRRLTAARHCPLTQLLTRDGWEKAALRRILQGNVAVAVIDLDSFKAVNDTFGHAAGDAVLKATGHRLHLWAGASDGTAGRLGGDEFALVLTADDFQTGIEQLHELLTTPVDWQGQSLKVGASIGAVPADGLTLSEALARADQAMYEVKGSGGRRGPRRQHEATTEDRSEVAQ
ncbi:GGDEF domain-containing protein [Streptomyces sp. NBC_01373]|uniref:GGDEF domain-containing protein n=1 Tax=Streptomyces sp. NBC_01373 TaxID=2903843 RepID=UPI00225619F2|nr:GGDEF domain-containing protein [Streptomyces sp. NBC_01373]MCX4707169.1 GGDEF domain-containing protein [Streptomyces sp. NBC_01373]